MNAVAWVSSDRIVIPASVVPPGRGKRRISDRAFLELCKANPEWRVEQTSKGDVILMPPTGGETGKRNFDLIGIFAKWVEKDGTGVGFDSSTLFQLSNGAKRSPDLAWVARERWEGLTERQRRKFPPICPDFVVELRSETDPLPSLQDKMREYIMNGARLGWLIDPLERTVYVYQRGREPVRLKNPKKLSGEPILPGFELALRRLW